MNNLYPEFTRFLTERVTRALEKHNLDVLRGYQRIFSRAMKGNVLKSGTTFGQVQRLYSNTFEEMGDIIWGEMDECLREARFQFSDELATDVMALGDKFFPSAVTGVLERLDSIAAQLRQPPDSSLHFLGT